MVAFTAYPKPPNIQATSLESIDADAQVRAPITVEEDAIPLVP